MVLSVINAGISLAHLLLDVVFQNYKLWNPFWGLFTRRKTNGKRTSYSTSLRYLESNCTARSAACNAPKSEQCAHGNGASERTEGKDAQGVRGPAGGPNEVRAGQRTDSGQWTDIELRYQCENGPERAFRRSLFSGLRQIALKGPVQGDRPRCKSEPNAAYVHGRYWHRLFCLQRCLRYLWYTHILL